MVTLVDIENDPFIQDYIAFNILTDYDLGVWGDDPLLSWANELVPLGTFIGTFSDQTSARGIGAPGDWYHVSGTFDYYEITATALDDLLVRAGTSQFPKSGVIVTKNNIITIFDEDLTTNELTMWMVFDSSYPNSVFDGLSLLSIEFNNSYLVVGTDLGLINVTMSLDSIERRNISGRSDFAGTIIDRHNPLGYVNNVVGAGFPGMGIDVSVALDLTGGINPVNQLPFPIMAFAGETGVYVVGSNNVINPITHQNGVSFTKSTYVLLSKTIDAIMFNMDDTPTINTPMYLGPIPDNNAGTIAVNNDTPALGINGYITYGVQLTIRKFDRNIKNPLDFTYEQISSPNGIALLFPDDLDQTNNSVNITGTNAATGLILRNTVGVWCCDYDDTLLAAGSTIDNTINTTNNLQTIGFAGAPMIRAKILQKGDMVAYGGFNPDTGINTPRTNNAFDVNDGNFAISLWVKRPSNIVNSTILFHGKFDSIQPAPPLIDISVPYILLGFNGSVAGTAPVSGSITFQVITPTDFARVDTFFAFDNDFWNHVVAIRNGGIVELYINGIYQVGFYDTLNYREFADPEVDLFNTAYSVSLGIPNRLHNGFISLFKFMKHAPNTSEVDALFQSEADLFGVDVALAQRRATISQNDIITQTYIRPTQ